MLRCLTRRVSGMMRNICGNDTSHLRCEEVRGRCNPTLRIGLISVVPAAQIHVRSSSFVLVLILSAFVTACSSRVEFERPVAQISTAAVNINSATVDDLERLPHIGRKTAEAIVEFRNANGPFRRVEQLMLIRGVSETRFAELAPFLRAD